MIGLVGRVPSAAAAAADGITVSPALQQINIKADETQHPIEFKITNNRADDQQIKLTVEDFNTLSDTGGLFFVGTNPTDLAKKYGLAQWVKLTQNSITVKAHQSANVDIAVLNLPSLAPGGHYGALLMSLTTNGNSSNKVGIQPIASSLLFVNKVGGDIHSLNLTKAQITRKFLGVPSAVNLTLIADGNTHVIPRGLVTLSDQKNNILSHGTINQDSNIWLPGTRRNVSVPLTQISKPGLFGHYNLTIAYRFDGYNKYRFYQTNLLIVSTKLVLGGIVLLLIFTTCCVLAFRFIQTKKL